MNSTYAKLAGGIATIVISITAISLTACNSTTTPLKPSSTSSPASSSASASAPAPPPPPSTPAKPADAPVLLNYSGSGTAVTPKFTSHSGNYVVSWSYSGNVDTSFGSSTPDNFIIEEDGGNDFNALGLPSDIQVSGHGSTSVTNDPGTHNFNVQANANAHWTVKVESE
jgi:hypothetical protein